MIQLAKMDEIRQNYCSKLMNIKQKSKEIRKKYTKLQKTKKIKTLTKPDCNKTPGLFQGHQIRFNKTIYINTH